MAIQFGTPGSQTMTVTNGDDFEEYRGLGGDDVYNVNPNLTDTVRISDSDGINTVVLGTADIALAQFFTGGAQFTYASGGVLQVLGDMSNFTFYYGGGTDPFNPVSGGTGQSFDETVTTFGLDPATLGLTPADAPVSGVVNADGTVGVTGPSFSVAASAAEVYEGESAVFTVTLSEALAADADITYTLAGVGGAVIGTDTDAVAETGTLTFIAGETTQTVTVPVTIDGVDETGEGLSLTLSDAPDGTSISGGGVAAVDFMDLPPATFSISASANSVVEGNGIVYTISSSTPVSEETTLTYSVTGDTLNGAATAASTGDYSPASGQVTFAVGETSKTVTINATDDGTTEGLEGWKFSVLDGDLQLIGSQTASVIDGESAGDTILLTTGSDVKIGTTGDDIFDGSVNANGQQTLTSVDNLNGGDGDDLLLAGLGAATTIAPFLASIESAELIDTAGATFDLANTTGMTSILVRNSTNGLTIQNIDSTTDTTYTIQDQSADLTLNFENAALVGSNSFTLNLNNSQSDALGGPTLTIAQQAGTDTSGLETLNLMSSGSNTNFLQTVTAQNAAGTSLLTSLNVTGAQGLQVTNAFEASVVNIDASGMTGALGLTSPFAATTVLNVMGSAGADSLTFAANAANSSIDAGAGNDMIAINNLDNNDTINGGDGTDRLDIQTAANAEGLVTDMTNITNFEQISMNVAGTAAATLNATRFGSAIDTVRLDHGTAGAYTVTMNAGAQTVGVAEPTAATNAQLGGALTVNDTGTATTDTLTITNRDTDTASATNNLNGQNLVINGFETTTINTGASFTVAQTLGTIGFNGDSATGANTLNFTGANPLTIGVPTSNSTGLFTIDASGMTGTATLTMGGAPTFSGANGTVSITGTGNNDTLLGHATVASTVAGGAGLDTITGGTGADSIDGGAGNDQITAAGGNDTVTGNDGNDTITVAAGTVSIDGGAGNDIVDIQATLTAGDTLAGGDGTDTLIYDAAATAATAAGVTGFETLQIDTALDQGLEQFTNNPGFTRINYNVAGNVNITNASASVDTVQVTTSGANVYSLARLIDTSSNSLNVVPLTGGARVVTTMTVDDEETLAINTGTTAGDNLTITTLNAADLTSLTVTGSNNVAITNAIAGAANLATVDASTSTGTLLVNASTSTANGTFTGPQTAAATITGGTGTDSITGGSAADSLTGGNGADTISGGGGADALLGGIGNDSISGGIGDDTITGGVGNDTLSGDDGADDFVFEAASNGVDTISGFVSTVDDLDVQTGGLLGGLNAGQTITAAAAAQALSTTLAASDTVHYISFNGAAANLTTGGAATLNQADMTATTLTNVAAYLGERFSTDTSGANANDSVVVVNWTAGSSTTSYVYEFVNDGADNVLQAAELTLIGVVDRGTTVLAVGDVV
ncbi:hypothetical protein MTBBW1_2200007 [Desulfamplus magnetovallimortis]|uniref:Calx-beta domain-containing protein n=1 Tax=Desulfamplus magnetovallimortis TaxID=1246637 RepID=A0A1W1HD46_9BACT|nr:Calx-beta domain-containing protein [Desulfamplus magnetovallimortis]SLM30353.1 hypothetical protein MTBBW1_2200007 [Desulfamplus magnetovallimortis]